MLSFTTPHSQCLSISRADEIVNTRLKERVLQSPPKSFIMCQGLELNLVGSQSVFVVGRQELPANGGTICYARCNSKERRCHQCVPGFSKVSFLGFLLVTKNDKNVPDTNGTKHSLNFQCDSFQYISIHQGKRCTKGMSAPKSVPVFICSFQFFQQQV